MTGFRRALNRLGTFVLYGGTTRLRSYERTIIERTIEALEPSDRGAFRAQLENLDHLKRLHGDRMVTFYFYDASHLPRTQRQSDELYIAKYQIVANSVRLTVSVVTHAGLLSSIEFSKSPTALESIPFHLKSLHVTQVGESVAEEIDRLEHED